ncbi:MAG: hypothetical protein GEU26_10385 [Nitrososphaeraceae archaeon]|nr:hypothetical protein [Nitrososphaeraceae archaeon]
MSKHTAKEYALRLNSFRRFVLDHYDSHMRVDHLIAKIREGSENPFNFLNGSAAYLLHSNNISNLTLKQRAHGA